jgi:hypothetical protein
VWTRNNEGGIMSRKIYAVLATAILVGAAAVSIAAASTSTITTSQTLALVARGGPATTWTPAPAVPASAMR